MAENEIIIKDSWKKNLYKYLQNKTESDGSEEELQKGKKEEVEIEEEIIPEEYVKRLTVAREVSGDCILYFDMLYNMPETVGFIVTGSFFLKLKNLFKHFANSDYYKAVKIKKKENIWTAFTNKEDQAMVYKLKFYKGIPKVNLKAEIIREMMKVCMKENSDMSDGVVQWIIIHYLYMVEEKQYAYKRDAILRNQGNKEYLSTMECLGSPLRDEVIELEKIRERLCKIV